MSQVGVGLTSQEELENIKLQTEVTELYPNTNLDKTKEQKVISMNIAIITACPSGVANSIIAAGLLEQAAAKLGWNAKIECQSSVVEPTLLTDADIEQAEAIVIAANTPVDTSRFVGKKVYQANISTVAKDAMAFLQTAVENSATLEQVTTVTAQVAAPAESASATKKIVAITACPTGVAHTFMAAEALEEEGKRRGHQIKVETRGSVGAKTN